MIKKNVILIGFMGVGKGTIARALAKKSKSFAIDTDDLVESLENTSIKKIFKINGEVYFRKLENKCALWLEENVTKTIISTGGGFYRQENLKKIGKVIYLESSFDGILNRIYQSPKAEKKLKKRPLLSNLEQAKKLYSERIVQYNEVSDIVINVENKGLNIIVNEILEKIDD